MSDEALHFRDLLFLDVDNFPLPRCKPASIKGWLKTIDGKAYHLDYSPHGVAYNIGDIQRTHASPNRYEMPSYGGLSLRWSYLHPLLGPYYPRPKNR